MNNKKYRLLILGNFESVYIVQFVKNLKKVNPDAHLFFWGYRRGQSDTDRSFLSCYDEYYLFDVNHRQDASFFQKVKTIIQLRKHFRKFASGKHFDYVNIHYVKPDYFFILDYLKKYSSKLVLTPWGSDIYRVSGLYKYFVKQIFTKSDYTTGADDRFTNDYRRIFQVPKNKMVFCNLGVEAIEYIVKHKDLIDTNEAKHQLGIDNSYVITCGYNATMAQRHLEIIDAINKIKTYLPLNLLLLFPLTYPNNPDYVMEIKQRVKEYDLQAVFYEDYVDVSRLFLLRQATDMFVHIQITDASCASLREYLLCEKKVVNGGWLHYPELIKNGHKPFFEVKSLEYLEQSIIDAYKSAPIQLEEDLLSFLKEKQWKVRIKDWDNLFSDNLVKR